jgi:hypothetical protein
MDIDDWAEQLVREGGDGLRRTLRASLAAVALRAEGYGRLNATDRLRVRTGRLRNSIQGTLEVTDDGFEVVLAAGRTRSTQLRYAAIQELGGTVRPKNGQMLAIPLPAAKTAAGVVRGEFSRVGGLRSVPGLFVITSRHGNKLLCRSVGKGKGARLVPLFFLTSKAIMLKARNFLHDALVKAADELPDAIGDALEIATRTS